MTSFIEQDDSPRRRAVYIDALRGFAIVLVVLGHCVQYNVAEFDQNLVFRFVYSFHMPLFMFISGFLAYTSITAPALVLQQKARTLLLPFVFWLPVMYLYLAGTSQAQVPGIELNPRSFVLNVLRSPDAGGLWFLWVLFLNYFSLFVALLLAPRHAAAVMLVIALGLNALVIAWPAANVLGIGLLRWHLVFFALGYLARIHENSFWRHANQHLLVLATFFVCLLAFWHRKNGGLFAQSFSSLNRSTTELLGHGFSFLTAITGVLTAFVAFKRMMLGVKVERVLARIGTLTLEIYAVHYYPLFLAVFLFGATTLPPTVRAALSTPTVLLTTLAAVAILRRSDALARLAFGRAVGRSAKSQPDSLRPPSCAS